MKQSKKVQWNIFDLFLILLVLLAFLSVYFTFIKPIHFSQLIKREAKMRFAEVNILLPDDLQWMKDVLPVGEEYRNVFGQLEWKVTRIGEDAYAGKKWAKVTAKILVAELDSGVTHYGKYTLAYGSKIYLINDKYMLEGRILNYKFLGEDVTS